MPLLIEVHCKKYLEDVGNFKFDDDEATFSTLIKEHNGREMPVFFLFFTTESALDI